MSFDVRPPGPGGAGPMYDATARLSADRTGGARFARVYELEEARRRRAADIPPMANDRIPEEVWDEVDAAARLVDRLAAEGRQMVFNTSRLNGGVVASLLDADGTSTKVSLSDVVDPGAAARAASADANGSNGAAGVA